MSDSENINVEKNFGGIHYYQNIASNPSYLAEIVNALTKLKLDELSNENNIIAFDIQEKIEYNNVNIYKYIIEDYSYYSTFISDTYSAISEIKPNCRDKIMKIINVEYRKIKAGLLAETNPSKKSKVNLIKEHSDFIIESVIKSLKSRLYESSNLKKEVHLEDIYIALEIIVGDAFINCKILENPNTA